MEIDVRSSKILDRRVTKNDQVFGRQPEHWEAENNPHLRYMMAAMAEIDPKYTQRLIEQGDRIQNSLDKDIMDVSYRRQGSVTNNTHIRSNSDVDLLVITKKFYSVEPPNKPLHPYNGDAKQDILHLRSQCVDSLRNRYPETMVDNTGSYSVAIEGGSLFCKVDVVPSNWCDSVRYIDYGHEFFRGIRVLDKDTLEYSINYPFLNNELLDAKDREHSGKLRRTIRLLKNIKADADEDIALSSYDICSLIYRISADTFTYNDGVMNTAFQVISGLKKVIDNAAYREGLLVIDGSRKIFDKEEKVVSLGISLSYLYRLYMQAQEAAVA